jgi:hypothetical protein
MAATAARPIPGFWICPARCPGRSRACRGPGPGVDVIKVDQPGTGDDTPGTGPLRGDLAAYSCRSTGIRSASDRSARRSHRVLGHTPGRRVDADLFAKKAVRRSSRRLSSHWAVSRRTCSTSRAARSSTSCRSRSTIRVRRRGFSILALRWLIVQLRTERLNRLIVDTDPSGPGAADVAVGRTDLPARRAVHRGRFGNPDLPRSSLRPRPPDR